jgi:hypothetical protein
MSDTQCCKTKIFTIATAVVAVAVGAYMYFDPCGCRARFFCKKDETAAKPETEETAVTAVAEVPQEAESVEEAAKEVVEETPDETEVAAEEAPVEAEAAVEEPVAEEPLAESGNTVVVDTDAAEEQ